MGKCQSTPDWDGYQSYSESNQVSVEPADYFRCQPGQNPYYGNQAVLEELECRDETSETSTEAATPAEETAPPRPVPGCHPSPDPSLWAHPHEPDLSRPANCAGQSHHSSDPAEIDVVQDAGDLSTWAAGAARIGEVDGDGTVSEAVDGILDRANGHPLRSVSFEGHGRPGIQEVGSKEYPEGGLHPDAMLQLRAPAQGGGFGPETEEALRRLTPHFTDDAEVTLGGCNTGGGESGRDLVAYSSLVMNVPVRASAEEDPEAQLQNPNLPGIEGPDIVCTPTPDGDATICRADNDPLTYRCTPASEGESVSCAPASPWGDVVSR